jgi:glycosyltransferase involved in cell wall biosynthesis
MQDRLPLVKVLLSAYNGEKYIGQQIDSLLAQTYPNIEIYVRDDGSKDGTLAVLKPYVEKGQIYLDAGKNLGFVKSFFTLIENAGDADYYAFCDQDDVWLEQKIQMAVDMLEKEDARKPLLYFSNYDLYDQDLNFMCHREGNKPKICFRNSLVDCVSLGFNSVFNRKAHDLTVEHIPQKSIGHDSWMYMLCAGLGKVIYDPRPTVKYRRHNANVSDAGDSFLKFQIWRFKRFFLNGYFGKVREQLREFETLHGDQLSLEDRKVLALFTKAGFHPVNTLKKVFYPKYFRQKAIDEVMIRCIMLLGLL